MGPTLLFWLFYVPSSAISILELAYQFLDTNVGTSRDIKVLLKALAQKVADEGREYITIYYGADIQEKHAQKAADLFAEICPDADVNLINGGQPVYYYLISAE